MTLVLLVKHHVFYLKALSYFQCSDKLGLSLELGSFAAGVMIATTDLAQHTLEQVRVYTRCGNCVWCEHTNIN